MTSREYLRPVSGYGWNEWWKTCPWPGNSARSITKRINLIILGNLKLQYIETKQKIMFFWDMLSFFLVGGKLVKIHCVEAPKTDHISPQNYAIRRQIKAQKAKNSYWNQISGSNAPCSSTKFTSLSSPFHDSYLWWVELGKREFINLPQTANAMKVVVTKHCGFAFLLCIENLPSHIVDSL